MVERAASLNGIRQLVRFLVPQFNSLVIRVIQQVFEVKDRLGHRLKVVRRGSKVEFTLNPFGDHELWAQAIRDVLGEFDKELLVQVTPIIQGTAATVYDKTTLLLGRVIPPNAPSRILSGIRPIAAQVTRINETTRSQMASIIGRGLDQELPVNEVARIMRDEMGDRFAARIPTIVRTEMGRSADLGRALSLKDSGLVRTVEVIGCQAVEPNIPTYQGRPTCNIKNVPVADSDTLEFHPNHTGTIVPETFVDDALEGVVTPDIPVNDPLTGNTAYSVSAVPYAPRQDSVSRLATDAILKKPSRVTSRQLTSYWQGAVGSIKATGTQVFIRLNQSNLKSVVKEGRFKSQFETHSSGGLLDVSGRIALEKQILGAPSTLKPEKRPIYGYLGKDDDKVSVSGLVAQFGAIRVALKPEIRKRTTWTIGDSLALEGSGVRSRPVNAPDLYGVPHDLLESDRVVSQIQSGTTLTTLTANSVRDSRSLSSTYIEAQIWDGLSVDDIERVTFPEGIAIEGSLMKVLQDNNIPFEVEG